MAHRVMHVEFVVLAFVGLLLPVFASWNNRRAGRRVFWAGFLVASVSAFFIAYPPDWQSGIAFSLLVVFMMLLTAYFTSPYIKIRGKVLAFHISDSMPDPSPGGAPEPSSNDPEFDPAPDSYNGTVTAGKAWWLLIFTAALFGFPVIIIDEAKPWLAPLSAVAFVAIAAGLGYGDASWGYSIARGQRVQFVIIAIITAGVFTILYLGGRYAGKRWPLRRKQSLEYRAHPRHQKRYP